MVRVRVTGSGSELGFGSGFRSGAQGLRVRVRVRSSYIATLGSNLGMQDLVRRLLYLNIRHQTCSQVIELGLGSGLRIGISIYHLFTHFVLSCEAYSPSTQLRTAQTISKIVSISIALHALSRHLAGKQLQMWPLQLKWSQHHMRDMQVSAEAASTVVEYFPVI